MRKIERFFVTDFKANTISKTNMSLAVPLLSEIEKRNPQRDSAIFISSWYMVNSVESINLTFYSASSTCITTQPWQVLMQPFTFCVFQS